MFPYVLFGDRFPLHEFLEFLQVPVCIECYTFTFSTVSSRPTGFLVVSFEGFGDVVVYDEPHVRFVYAHAERYCRDNDVNVLHEEFVLCVRTCRRVEACVVCRRFNVVSLQDGSEFLHFLS